MRHNIPWSTESMIIPAQSGLISYLYIYRALTSAVLSAQSILQAQYCCSLQDVRRGQSPSTLSSSPAGNSFSFSLAPNEGWFHRVPRMSSGDLWPFLLTRCGMGTLGPGAWLIEAIPAEMVNGHSEPSPGRERNACHFPEQAQGFAGCQSCRGCHQPSRDSPSSAGLPGSGSASRDRAPGAGAPCHERGCLQHRAT